MSGTTLYKIAVVGHEFIPIFHVQAGLQWEAACTPAPGKIGSAIFFCHHPGSQSFLQARGPKKQGCYPQILGRTDMVFQAENRERRSVHNSTGAGLFFKCLCSESGHSLKCVLIITGVTDGKDL
jgi:hypothetical protein